jgi:hypothetical protein
MFFFGSKEAEEEEELAQDRRNPSVGTTSANLDT